MHIAETPRYHPPQPEKNCVKNPLTIEHQQRMAFFQGLSFSNSTRFSGFTAKTVSLGSYRIRCEERGYLGADEEKKDGKKRVRILIAGGGVGGLVLALAAKKRGYEVKVFEKDLSAVRGEGQHRGPIQLLSSALAVLEAIDEDVARRIMEAGCVTGDRINGLADGISGEWFTKFDLLTPAVTRGLPVTQVICRIALQDILVSAVGQEILSNNSKVVDFVEDSGKVKVILEDGRQFEGDVLVGADGIWSKVRSKLFGSQPAKYSNYTCYSGLTSFRPPYIDTVGYRVFLGANQYFVASDVGSGKMQWYAFHKEAPMNHDPPGDKKERLLKLFGRWCTEVVMLISETPEVLILQRDIYDRDMIYSWGVGCVTLLGDAAHPMQPNLGQGGCMAIEDCYQLILELDNITENGTDVCLPNEIASALKRYEEKRMFRISVVHTMSRMASRMLAEYRPYVDFGSGPLSHLSDWQIKHPAIPIARVFMQAFLPQVMSWMIAGHGLW
ncbi:zeaxanthin epoxidase, chloroplastic-like isoform X3 [Rhododendron vialii]|uniref:zeaxanthin epoxidase, chloroplastic-like isoform X3 n=1 Tax=Rhododendron vialii TaxID=182163 RepID=UPI00265ED683|nr:zeaxanthin epoxidase, chloroplastic-like isoform X3 [Rhododendron vialii]